MPIEVTNLTIHVKFDKFRQMNAHFSVCVLLCFIKPILGNRYVRSQGFIVSEPSETHPRSVTDEIWLDLTHN